jgi:hypothetical protein
MAEGTTLTRINARGRRSAPIPTPSWWYLRSLPDEQTALIKPGYYASHMTADTVQELIGEE